MAISEAIKIINKTLAHFCNTAGLNVTNEVRINK